MRRARRPSTAAIHAATTASFALRCPSTIDASPST
jgi:hypothetical protein